MSLFTIQNEKLTFRMDPQTCQMEAVLPHATWRFEDRPGIIMHNGEVLLLKDARCTAEYYNTGIHTGVRATYTDFMSENHRPFPNLVMHTYTAFDVDTGDLRFRFYISGDQNGEVQEVSYPAPVIYDPQKGHGCTVLNLMQGMLYMAGTPIYLSSGVIFERDAYLPFWGQIKDGSGYMAIFDTPYDVRYYPCGETKDQMKPLWRPSMGTVRYPREMIYQFYDTEAHPSYVTFAKAYRKYLMDRGQFVSLKEKLVRNPNAAYMLGAPIVHFDTAHNYSPDCKIYKKGTPRHYQISFETRAKELEKLHENGLKKAYIHVDGWGVNGYDNQHPDTFPINEEAGGVKGFQILEHTTRNLGYRFGIHDQYRDYYYDARTFSFENATMLADGTFPFCNTWDGGNHTYLCTSLATAYVRRNYQYFEALGIQIDGAYLDVFSIVEPDECTNPDHPMSRKECTEYRKQCIQFLNQRGIISSSEEAAGFLVPDLIMSHHAPYLGVELKDYDKMIPIPLFNLVFHDSMIIPWFGLEGKTVDDTHLFNLKEIWGYLAAMLNGGTIYVDIWENAEVIARLKPLMELHKRVATQEMLNHEFLSDDCTKQRTTFADGTQVTVDLKNETWQIDYPEQTK